MVINPRPFGQILGDATNVLARVWKAVLGPAILASIPVGVMTIVAFNVTGGDEFMELALNNPEAFETMTNEELFDVLIPFYLAVGVAIVLQTILGVYLHLVAARAVILDLNGDEVTSGEITRQAALRFGRGLFAVVVVVVSLIALVVLAIFIWSVPFVSVGTPNPGSVMVAFVLFVLLLAPSVWAAVSVSVTPAVVGVEDRTALASIQRSMRLVRGRWLATAGYIVLVGLLGSIAIQLIQLIAFPFAATGSGGLAILVGAMLGVLAQGVIIVVIGVTYTHWYIDLRARKETLTSEGLASDDPTPPQLPPAPPLS